MAHRDQVRGLFGRHDSREPRHLKWIALWIFWQCFQDLGLEDNEGAGLGLAARSRLVADVDHPDLASAIVVRELSGHGRDILQGASFKVSRFQSFKDNERPTRSR